MVEIKVPVTKVRLTTIGSVKEDNGKNLTKEERDMLYPGPEPVPELEEYLEAQADAVGPDEVVDEFKNKNDKNEPSA